MSDQEYAVYFYSTLHEEYGWTRKEIDNEDFEYVLDLLIVKSKFNQSNDAEKESYIDDHF